MSQFGEGDPPRRLRLGVLLSGGGRTFQNLHESCTRGELPAEVVLVISSTPAAYGMERARLVSVPVLVVERRALDQDAFHTRITQALVEAEVDLVCMAGFTSLWRIPPAFEGRVLNIHPALLPKFGGKGYYGERVHRAVLEAGEGESGCTVHYCDNQYDHGPIVVQRSVPVRAEDTAESLAVRVFAQECIAYPEAIRQHLRSLARSG
ncbi:MAG: phosphoribosylglycinamide formyltransferase [bacterium]|nr:phosphoribosylglycinamide formyltransferase [bacterium]